MNGLRSLLIVLLSFFCVEAFAGAFRVSPLRLDYDPANNKRRTLSVTVTNLGNQPIVLQLEAKSWKQIDGVDVYEATKDLFFAPPIITIRPQQQRVIPVRLKTSQDATLEKAYRFYVEEIAAPNAEGRAAMDFKARFGIPVFVAPIAKVDRNPTVSTRLIDPNTMEITVANDNARHIRIPKIEIYPAKFSSPDDGKAPLAKANANSKNSAYLLGNQTGTWTARSNQPFPERDLTAWIYTDITEAPIIEGMPEGTLRTLLAVQRKELEAIPSTVHPVEIVPVLPPTDEPLEAPGQTK